MLKIKIVFLLRRSWSEYYIKVIKLMHYHLSLKWLISRLKVTRNHFVIFNYIETGQISESVQKASDDH